MQTRLITLFIIVCLLMGCVSSDDHIDVDYIAVAQYMRKLVKEYESIPVERVSRVDVQGNSSVRASILPRHRYVERRGESWSELSDKLAAIGRNTTSSRFSDDAVFLLAHVELIQSCGGLRREHCEASLCAFERYAGSYDVRQIEQETSRILGGTQTFKAIEAGLAALPDELPEPDKLLIYSLFQKARLFGLSGRTDDALAALGRIQDACSDPHVLVMVEDVKRGLSSP